MSDEDFSSETDDSYDEDYDEEEEEEVPEEGEWDDFFQKYRKEKEEETPSDAPKDFQPTTLVLAAPEERDVPTSASKEVTAILEEATSPRLSTTAPVAVTEPAPSPPAEPVSEKETLSPKAAEVARILAEKKAQLPSSSKEEVKEEVEVAAGAEVSKRSSRESKVEGAPSSPTTKRAKKSKPDRSLLSKLKGHSTSSMEAQSDSEGDSKATKRTSTKKDKSRAVGSSPNTEMPSEAITENFEDLPKEVITPPRSQLASTPSMPKDTESDKKRSILGRFKIKKEKTDKDSKEKDQKEKDTKEKDSKDKDRERDRSSSAPKEKKVAITRIQALGRGYLFRRRFRALGGMRSSLRTGTE